MSDKDIPAVCEWVGSQVWNTQVQQLLCILQIAFFVDEPLAELLHARIHNYTCEEVEG